MSKLTLSVEDDVIRQAKRWAAREGTSISRLVERYLREASSDGGSGRGAAETPVLRRLRGCLKGVDAEAHRRHLEAKHG
ncbi:hypothetical protein FBQ97_21200 [Acidobacteria bacterium ACD]|nr:hypothetical protein [Acidobacteria bacterium ACD]